VTEEWRRYDGSQCVHRPAQISPERLTAMFWWLYRKVFSLGSILKRTVLNPAVAKRPLLCLLAFGVNLHYRKYVMRKVPPNIF
jgi:hypothetical protein